MKLSFWTLGMPPWSNAEFAAKAAELGYEGIDIRCTNGGQISADSSEDEIDDVLKTYAADGENELHAHPNEDHAFVILQGKARFHGPNSEEKAIGKNEGVLLPHGTLYWFKAVGKEPLVLLRIGCAAVDGATHRGRVNVNGKPMAGDSAENKTVKQVMSDRWFG